MAAGRPFVATAGPGSHLWRLQEETGAFQCVPPGDSEALADAVLALGMDAERRADLGARGRAFVVKRHDKAAVLGLFEAALRQLRRSEEHTSELQSLMRISYAVFCLKKKKTIINQVSTTQGQ